MRIVLAALAVLVVLAAPARAEGNKIIVIGEDGSVSELDLGAPAKPSPAPATPPPVQLRTKPAPPPVAAKPATAKPVAAKPAAPAPEKLAKPAKKPAPPAPAKKAGAPAKKKSQKKQAAPANVDQQKVDQHSPAADSAPAPVPARGPRLGPAMTPDDAIRIALDHAPPARSVNAYPVNYNGIHAYQVVFATEDGDRSVFVDRESGKIVE